MRPSPVAWLAALAAAPLSLAPAAMAAGELNQPGMIATTDFEYGDYYGAADGSPSDAIPPAPLPSATIQASSPAPNAFAAVGATPCCDLCETDCADACGGDVCCGSSCGGGGFSFCPFHCNLGEPFAVSSLVLNECSPWFFGGWTQAGIHTENTRFSVEDNDALAFNDHPGRINLHQQWLYFGKNADGSDGLDWGFRADIMYGTDAVKTQAFGGNPGTWDYQNGWDRGGGYGGALPQLYGELACGDWSVKMGHFFTLVGYEVVAAPDNFFYSHAFTMFNSEPFTHTGALATYSGFENVEFYGGWVAGWDTGFTQNQGGSMWLGGASVGVTDNVNLTYINYIGNFGAKSAGETGYGHSVVANCTISDRLNYVFQSDYVDAGDVTGFDSIGVNQYLFYSFNDCLAAGARMEWYKLDGTSYQGLTYGLNYKCHSNIIVRPELRHNWTNENDADLADFNQTVFGVDAIFTY
ncbi:hypothetical protein Pla175_20140 [Pirellulimonas nuda]|uniref:Secreted protein n=1 Tax=Pirellulimonas nuda TaxID=2528009 RepID=A0A518DAX4_9BACT|nr:outer membrane beta-barrel protein [Pirellulimonas nuda]QDU88634.1 hypothetical protein Pla175_20140 [Pirellulimonas nuda]